MDAHHISEAHTSVCTIELYCPYHHPCEPNYNGTVTAWGSHEIILQNAVRSLSFELNLKIKMPTMVLLSLTKS